MEVFLLFSLLEWYGLLNPRWLPQFSCWHPMKDGKPCECLCGQYSRHRSWIMSASNNSINGLIICRITWIKRLVRSTYKSYKIRSVTKWYKHSRWEAMMKAASKYQEFNGKSYFGWSSICSTTIPLSILCALSLPGPPFLHSSCDHLSHCLKTLYCINSAEQSPSLGPFRFHLGLLTKTEMSSGGSIVLRKLMTQCPYTMKMDSKRCRENDWQRRKRTEKGKKNNRQKKAGISIASIEVGRYPYKIVPQ